MNTSSRPSEPTLVRVLHEITDVPEPPDMADRALTGARGLRRRRTALTALAAVAAIAALTVPFALRAGGAAGTPSPDAPPDAGVGAPFHVDPAGPALTRSALGECVFLPRPGVKEKRVEPADWPEFVRLTIGKLPARGDYVMQSGYGVCAPGAEAAMPAVADGYAVVNLGPRREHGHLTLNLRTPPLPGHASTCAALRDGQTVLFCVDGTATTAMVSGTRREDTITVSALYPDRRLVYIESHPAAPGAPPAIGADELRRVVTDPALAALLPSA